MSLKYVLFTLCILAKSSDAAVRSAQQSTVTTQDPSIIYVPIPLNTENPYLAHSSPTVASHHAKEPRWFPYFISILGSIGKIFLNPHDRPHVKQHVSDLIDNVVALAHEVSHRSLSSGHRLAIIRKLMKDLELLATQLPKPIII